MQVMYPPRNPDFYVYRAELMLSHDKLFSMPKVTPILTNMYIIHNNTHMGP